MKTLIALLLGSSAIGAVADTRIRTEVYDKGTVYQVRTRVGIATLIQLEEDETIKNTPASVLGIGDADAWSLGVRGNNIALKPTQRLPDTNLVVVTNKRTYSFDLSTASKEVAPTYVLRFRYPDSEAARAAAEAAAEAKRALSLAATRAERPVLNTEYVWRGDAEALKPTAAWDDGRLTRLVYDHGAELPVFFKVLPDGSEVLVNYSVDAQDPGTVLIHEVARLLRARMGDSVIEIKNAAYVPPRLNTSRAGMVGTVRVNKGEQP